MTEQTTRWVITDTHGGPRREVETEASEPQAAFREVFGVFAAELPNAAELGYPVRDECRSCEVGKDEIELEFESPIFWYLDFVRADDDGGGALTASVPRKGGGPRAGAAVLESRQKAGRVAPNRRRRPRWTGAPRPTG